MKGQDNEETTFDRSRRAGERRLQQHTIDHQ
jgi:hypothetical protein